MNACQISQQTSLDDDTREAIGRAFEEVWEDVASNFSNPHTIEAARSKLARAIVAVANVARGDVGELRRAGLKAMTEHYDF
jgi:hypothetical protein